MFFKNLASWFLGFALLLSACSRYHLVEEKVFEDKKLRVDLVNEVGPQGITVKKNYNHPQVVSEDDFKSLLHSLHFKDPVFLWKEKDQEIFSAEEIATLAPLFVQALAKAQPDQMIGFSIQTFKRDLVFGTDKLTTGFLFFDEKGAHWVFGNVNFGIGQDGDPYLANPTYQPPRGIKLVAGEGQTLYRPQHPLWYQPKVFDNWLIVEAPFVKSAIAASPTQLKPQVEPLATVAKTPVQSTQKPAPAMTTPVAPKPAPAPVGASVSEETEPSNTTERLRKLKMLRDEKLITKEDYEQKKKEILKDL